LLGLVFDSRPLNQLQAVDLAFDESNAAGDDATAGMLDDEGRVMQRRMGRPDR
jgi:hypothetical protein